jgi:hypothetical protein
MKLDKKKAIFIEFLINILLKNPYGPLDVLSCLITKLVDLVLFGAWTRRGRRLKDTGT